mmetsp:Transcript_1052/g.1604  ORF Transcript_1052/g.1604 Transcript_1052/m.1604 type:complete len:473 (+) Transcript_1052:19-1437(+)
MTTSDIPQLSSEEAENAIQAFVKILQYQTVSATAPDTGAYIECAKFLIEQLESIPCLDDIHILEESPEHSPVVMARWKGADETLPIILLNSHYDVVPAVEEDWEVPCFEGFRKDGRVYGRGAQDMKCVCIQYMEAIRKLHQSKPDYHPSRSIYLSFVPDEEIGGSGMAAILSSKLYKSFPGIAIALDEGLASTDDTYSVFYGERLPWWVEVTAKGNTGHGSRFIENTAVEQIVEIANRALAFREGQRAALHGSADEAKHANCAHAVAAKKRRLAKGSGPLSMGDVTSLNVTTLQAGVRAGDTFVYNCVPPIASCSLDIRISPHVQPSEIKNMLDGWCRECSSSPETGHQVSWDYIGGQGGDDLQDHALTSTDTRVNPWYGVFGGALESMKLKFVPEVFPAATDSRFLRALGIRALGFSPMRNSEIMLHEDNEYLDESVFLEGIGVYVGLIEALGKQGPQLDIEADGKVANGR